MAKPKGAPKTGGRQKGTPNKVVSEIKTIAREYCPEAVRELARLAGLADGGSGKAESEQARIGALNAILDRGYGKPAQSVTGEDGDGPIQHAIEVTFVRPGKADKA